MDSDYNVSLHHTDSTRRSAITIRNALLAAPATALTALALLISAAPAHARPPIPLAPGCGQYSFSGPFTLRQSNGYRMEADLHGTSATSQPAVGIAPDGHRLNGYFNADSDITGRKVHFAIYFNDANGGVYDGDVDDDGFVHGVGRYAVDAKLQGVSWDSETPLVCLKPQSGAPGVAEVIADVDIYDQPDGVGNKYPGIYLHTGRKLDLVEPCRDNWCHLVIPEVPGGTGWAYQDGFLRVA